MIDLICTKSQYLAHVGPIWDALPERGAVVKDRKGRTSPAVLVASGRDLARARQIGYRRVALVEHGIGQSYGNGSMGYPGGKGRDHVSLFLSPNGTAAGNDARVYPDATVTAIGDPRLDTLPKREPGPFTGIKCDPWKDLLAAIRNQDTTSEYDPAAKGLCVAHAIANASANAPGSRNSQAIGRSLNTTGGDISAAGRTLSRDQRVRDRTAMEALTSATSTCTRNLHGRCRGSAISAGRPVDLKWLSDGTLQKSFGESIRGSGSHSLQIQTTTFGSVSLVIPCTTPRVAITAPAVQGVVACSFHWNGMNQALSAVSHYRRILGELAKAYPVLGHCHPFTEPTITPLYRRFGIPFEPSFDEVCRKADLYIADNTSTLYEFASTGRPVVVLNRPDWDRDVELGLRFWEASRVGINVDEPEQLLAAVERALSDPPEVQADREHALSIAYAHRSGAAERGAAAISAWLQ